MSSALVGILAALMRLLSGGLLEQVLTILRQRSDTEVAQARMRTETTIAAIQAEVAARTAARDVVVAEQKWWLTAAIRPAFAAPLLLWWWLMIADAVLPWRLGIRNLPTPLDEWAGWIVLAYFLTAPFSGRRA